MRDFEDRRFVGLLEAAPDAMVCADSDGQIALVNAQAERLFGYDRDEMVGQLAEMLVPDAVRPVHPGHRAGYVADPQPRPMGAGIELAGRRRDGSTFPAEISLSAIDTDQGILVTAAVRDVTDRQRAHETAARLASIIQSSHHAVIGKTLDQVITSWNPAAERLYGYTAEQMIGQHVAVLFPPGEGEREGQMLAAVARGERVDEHKTHRVCKDGSIISVSLTLSPITDATGKITGISTVARDVTDRQRAAARFTGLLEAAPDAMVCADSDGQIALVNAQAERLFGYDRDEMVGQPVEMLVPDAVRPVHPGHRAGYVADPQPRPMGAGMELAGRRRDGSTFPAEISLSAIDTDQGILVTAAVRDVTDRQRAEDRFTGLLEAAPDAMVCVDSDGQIALVNAQAERLFGYDRDEMVGQPVEMLVPDAVRPVHPGHRAGYVADPQPRPMGAGMELAGRRRDGSTFPAEISLSAIDTDQGILVTAAIRDVTDRQRAEDRFTGLLEAAPDAMVCADSDGQIALVNAQAERLFGYDRDEMVGQPVEMLVPDAVRPVHPGHRAGYVADPQPRPMGAGMELAGRRRDGSTFPAEISLSAIDTDQGILVTAAIRDVTDRQRAEDRFTGLLEAAPDAMVCADSDGQIALVNAQAERLVGYDA